MSSPEAAVHPSLDDATRPERDPTHPGRYRVELEPKWNAPMFPQGGVVSAIALRAMALELDDPRHELHSSTTLFASPVDNGEIVVDVEVIRSGRSMSQCMARVSNPASDEPGHRILAAFGSPREDEFFEFTPLRPPEAPPPLECEPPPTPPPDLPPWPEGFFNRCEIRRVRQFHSWETDWEGGRAESIRWTRYYRPPEDADGLLPNWALLALSDTMPGSVGQYVGPGSPPFMAPSVDLTMHYFDRPKPSDWVLMRSHCRRAHRGYASAENELWSESGELLAYATQSMLLRMNVRPKA